MLTEYSYSKSFSYPEYLARGDLSGSIDIHVSKAIREAVGNVAEIYGDLQTKNDTPVAKFRGESSYAGYALEIVSANLEDAWESLNIGNANLVNAFQSIFLARDEKNPAVSHLLPADRSDGASGVEMAVELFHKRMFPEALSALGRRGEPNADRDRLLGAIRLGICGIPESVATLDLVEAEKSFLRAARNASPHVVSHSLIGAARAAYVQGRFVEAEANLSGAIAADPTAAEAYYQMARLRLHAADLESVESFLERAFGLHWSFAMRAASDVLFVVNPGPAVSAAEAVSKRILRDQVAPGLQRLTSQVQLLADRELTRHPISTQKSYVELSSSVGHLTEASKGGRLKVAHQSRVRLSALQAGLADVCNEYTRTLLAKGADATEGDVESAPVKRSPRIHDRPAMLTGAFAFIVLLLAAVFLVPELAAALGRSQFGTLVFLKWTSKVLFIWFALGLFAVPAFWLLIRTDLVRKRLRRKHDDLPQAGSDGKRVNAEVADVVGFVEEMARAYEKDPVERAGSRHAEARYARSERAR
jgi:tetratricopeptide (TPR) repeat protein